MRQLADGHWVLAFPDVERASAARQLVQQHAAALRAAYGRHLAPLTGEADSGGGGNGDGGPGHEWGGGGSGGEE